MLTGTLTTNRTLSRRTIRDTDPPDLGYHYPAVDYAARDWVVGNATATLQGGVVVAAASPTNWASIWLSPGKLVSQQNRRPICDNCRA